MRRLGDRIYAAASVRVTRRPRGSSAGLPSRRLLGPRAAQVVRGPVAVLPVANTGKGRGEAPGGAEMPYVRYLHYSIILPLNHPFINDWLITIARD